VPLRGHEPDGNKPPLINTKANTPHVNPIDTFSRIERTLDSACYPCSSTLHGQRSGDPLTDVDVVSLDLTTTLFWSRR